LTNNANYDIINISKEREVIEMRNLKYQLSNGNTVNTLHEARTSGLQYSTYCEPIYEEITINPDLRRKRVTKLVARAES